VPGQIGLEETPEEWLAKLVEVFREVRRVLHPSGTLWLNCGDAYASSWACSRRNVIGNGSPDEDCSRPNRLVGDLKEKDLIGLPWMLAFALRADGWWLRSEIIWHKPNPMPESVTDRPTKAHEQLFLLSKRANYFYDAEAIKEPAVAGFNGSTFTEGKTALNGERQGLGLGPRNDNGIRNKRSVWTIPSEAYPDSHFATFPTDLVKPCILAGTSARGVCPRCLAPWERILEQNFLQDGAARNQGPKGMDESNGWSMFPRGTTATKTLGWRPSCSCDAGPPIPATVCDCFCGTATSCAVALELGRNAIGIELSPAYLKLAERRCAAVTPGFPQLA
jgi:DNA modification methylase